MDKFYNGDDSRCWQVDTTPSHDVQMVGVAGPAVTLCQWLVNVRPKGQPGQATDSLPPLLSFCFRPAQHLIPCGTTCQGAGPPSHAQQQLTKDAQTWEPLARQVAARGFASLIDVERDVERSLLEDRQVMGNTGTTPQALAALPAAAAPLPGDAGSAEALGGLFVFMLSHLLQAAGTTQPLA